MQELGYRRFIAITMRHPFKLEISPLFRSSERVALLGLLLVFVLPFSVAVVQLIAEVGSGIAFARQERLGLHYHQELRQLLEAVVRYRRLLLTVQEGDRSVEPALRSTHQEIAQIMAQLSRPDVEQQWLQPLKAREVWRTVQQQWQRGQTPTATIPMDLAASQQLTQDILTLMRHVGDTSNLILDPVLDAYYLMDTIVSELPVAIDNTVKARELGWQLTKRQTRTSAEEANLIVLSSQVNAPTQDIRRGLQIAFQQTPSLQPQLKPAWESMLSTTDRWLTLTDQALLTQQRMTLPARSYAQATDQAIASQFALYDVTAPGLDRLLQNRIAQLTQKQLLVLAFAGLVLILVAIASFLFMQNLRQRRRAEASLRQANDEIQSLNERLKEENLRMSAELATARRIQQMILPKEDELQRVDGLEVAGFMEPANEVGGDYYDVLEQNGRVKIGIGDVTGHGLESGMLMLMAQTAVRTLLLSNETNPTRFLSILNQTLYDNVQRMKSDKNMTLSLVDYEQGLLRLSGQHESMIVIRQDGELEVVDTLDLGFPVALEREITDFVNHTEISLNSGDVVVLYTDGITEAENPDRQLYGLERLCEQVKTHRHESAEMIKQLIIADVQQFMGTQRMFDDITLVVLKQR